MSKRILYFHHSVNVEGSARSLAFLIKELDRRQYEPILAVPREGPASRLFADAGAEVVFDARIAPFHGTTSHICEGRLDAGRRFCLCALQAAGSYAAAKRIIATVQPDLVHANSATLFMVAKAARAVSTKVKVVIHVRETLLDSLSGKILRYMNHRYADAYIAIDSHGLSKLDTRNRHVRVVHNFVDLSLYCPKGSGRGEKDVLREYAHLAPQALVVLYLARVARGNGALELVRMAKQLRERQPTCHFFLVGFDAPVLSRYQQAVMREIVDLPTIHPMEFRADVVNVMASADVLVCPFTEPHSARSVIEAAAMGIPAVVSDLPGLNELVVHGTTGLLYQSGSQDSFLQCMELICAGDDLRPRLGRGALEYARAHFDGKVNARQTCEIYEQLLNG